MLKINNCVLFGITAFLYCSNIINAMDYKLNNSITGEKSNISLSLSNSLVLKKLGDDTNLDSRNNFSQMVRYSTKCRGVNNIYNNHVLLEVIDITKSIDRTSLNNINETNRKINVQSEKKRNDFKKRADKERIEWLKKYYHNRAKFFQQRLEGKQNEECYEININNDYNENHIV